MDKQTTIQALITGVLAALTYYFSILAVPTCVLFVVMIVDYLTGMISARKKNEWSSKTGLFGIVKKLCYLFAVVAGGGIDWLIYSGLSLAGIQTNYTIMFGVLITIWLIINEIISILENLTEIGVPLPKFIFSVTRRLKVVAENTVENKEE